MILIIQHVENEGPGTIGDFFRNTSWEVKIVKLDNGHVSLPVKKTFKRLLNNLSCLEAMIVLGGPMNVYEQDKYPFLQYEETLVKKAIKRRIPIMGICLGAQIIAKACGAGIRKAQHREIGWYRVRLNSQGRKDRLFCGLEKKWTVFQWHEDTFEIPEGGELLATSQLCKNQTFRYGENAYGLQFHMEITDMMIRDWITEYGTDMQAAAQLQAKQMLIDYYDMQKELDILSHRICFNFSKMIAGNRQ